MNFQPKAKFDKEATLILVEKSSLSARGSGFIPSDLRSQIQELVKSGHFKAEKGELFPFVKNKKLFLLAGLGNIKELSLTDLRINVRKALTSPYLHPVKDAEIIPHTDEENALIAMIESVLIGGYVWKKYRSEPEEETIPESKEFILITVKKKILEEAVRVCEGVNLARDLVNDNADVATSEFIEKTIKDLIKGQENMTIEVLNRKEMAAKGLNLILAVNQGSPKEPKLIIVKYQGGQTKDKYVGLVGKGITFDTGGLNLKPTGHIETMRADMSGTAAVVGTLKNTLALGIRRNILFVFALAENAIGSQSFKPGDVFRSFSGKTVEIANTDAEGRLVLADAIAYVVKHYRPQRIVDLATLTGACVVALGHDYAGLMSTDDQLAEELLNSAQRTDDRLWRLPIYPEVKESVKSLIADIKNTGFPKGAAGAITGAEFLRQFTDDTPWAHLDIAGTAYVDGPGRWYYGQGATGFGVRLLTDFLKNSKRV